MTDRKPRTPETHVEEPIPTIPDDPEHSVYRFIIVAAKRARQIQSGAKPKLINISRKPTRTAVEETRRGLVLFMDPATAPPPEETEEEPPDQ